MTDFPPNPTLADCVDAAGSINTPGPTPSAPITYVAPNICIGENVIADPYCIDESSYQESIAAENLNASGATLNIFKLLGVHEQGKLIDLTGNGHAIGCGNPDLAFDGLAASWVSSQEGAAVVTDPAWIGYDFGPRLTSFGQKETGPDSDVMQHITSFRIKQGGEATTRALQVRVDRSMGGYHIDPLKVQFTGSGNGGLGAFVTGASPRPGTIMAIAQTSTTFAVMFTVPGETRVLGVATVGKRFNADIGSFQINAGSVPFAPNDMFSAHVDLQWLRVDVVNLPNMPTPSLIRIKQSAASRYWRLVPLSFAGTMVDDSWVVDSLELFDYQTTRLDDIQDSLFMENRDRDYAKSSLVLKAAYTTFDAMSDMSKFGFQMSDIYTFSTSFAMMIALLGRPIVVGDIIELPNEAQWDHNMHRVKKFLEVSDVGWSAEGYTAGWKPIIYRFQAQQLIPSQETRDILGTADTQKYIIDDGSFFAGIEQIQTAPLTVSEANNSEAILAVPEKGTNVREAASGTNRFNQPGSYDGVGLYVEDGFPPDGAHYDTGFKLPDRADSTDGQFFRLEYDPKTQIPAVLYKFSSMKNKWIYVETDRRTQRNAHTPSQQAVFNTGNTISLRTKKI